MSAPLSTSRVFVAARTARDRLVNSADIPLSPVTGKRPAVGFAAVPHGADRETIVVRPVVGEDSQIVWDSMPNRRTETFGLEILVETGSWSSEDQAIDRLEVLTDGVQRTFYDDRVGDVVSVVGAAGLALDGVQSVQFEVTVDSDGRYRGGSAVFYTVTATI